MNREEVYSGHHFAIYAEDGKITDMGFDDGVGFVGAIERSDIEDLYLFLHKHFADKSQSNLETENKRLEELAQGRRELLDYDDKRILELSTENKELKEQCARLQQEYIRMFNQLYKEDK